MEYRYKEKMVLHLAILSILSSMWPQAISSSERADSAIVFSLAMRCHYLNLLDSSYPIVANGIYILAESPYTY